MITVNTGIITSSPIAVITDHQSINQRNLKVSNVIGATKDDGIFVKEKYGERTNEVYKIS